MNYYVSIQNNTENKADKMLSSQITIENDKKDKGLSSLKKGQHITGMVAAVGDQVTLDFSGQEVKTSKSLFENVKPGEIKTFEVMSATNSEIELKVLDDSPISSTKTFKADISKDADWESILAKKEQIAKKAEKEAQLNATKSKLDEINSKLTELDCKRLEKEGFPLETFTVDGLYEVLNRVKQNITQNKQYTEEETTGVSFDEKSLVIRLKEENLPTTSENVTKITKALELSAAVSKIDDKAMQYLISTEAEPSIENIYKAYYSGNNQADDTKLSQNAWKELENQVTDTIKAAGYDVNEENLADAKWLIENKLPLTTETFTYKKNLKEIKLNSDQDSIVDKMIEGMKNGINPKDVGLISEDMTNAKQIITDIKSISEEAIVKAVKEDSTLTIKNLVTIQESLSFMSDSKRENFVVESGEEVADGIIETAKADGTTQELENTETAAAKDYRYEEIKAKRQLEEIRLKMTLEAANQLEKKGISIETKRLEEVVEELKELENNYYKNLLKEAEADASEISIQTLKDTTQGIEKLKYMPCDILGSTLPLRNEQTITELLAEGSKVQADYAKAGTAYETLMTVPNSEYGDSIKKAFANADSMLTQMNLDRTEQNRRAIRILGYNQMEITEESINQVKAYDKQVVTLMENLHPAVTVRMIKEGINPMEMPINELNTTIDNMKEEQGITSEDKYSTYLRNLEKQEGITPEERNAYIGIYRLLYNVNKSDGAAVGAVVKADREITLSNLLTAVQTNKKGNLNAIINDEFGTLQSISFAKETIAGQLSSFLDGEGQNSEQSSKENLAKEQTEYLDRVLKQIKDEITPEKLMETGNNMTRTSLGGSSASTSISSGRGIWETIKEVPVEKLLEQLQNMDELQTAEDETYTRKVQNIRELCKNSEQSIRFLNDYHVASTPLNITMASQLLNNGDTAIKRLIKLKNENKTEIAENSLKEISNLSDTLIDKHSMEESYRQLESDATAALTQACSEEIIDSKKLAELKSIGQQMTFFRTLAEKEFYQIPIETEKGITNMNLTILRGTESSGKVSVNVQSEQLGNIKAEFSLKEQSLKGYFSSDNKKGLDQLQNNTEEIKNVAQENNISIKQMDFSLQKREGDTYSYQSPEGEGKETSVSNDTERILYRVAKAVVQTIRLAENSETNQEKAVS